MIRLEGNSINNNFFKIFMPIYKEFKLYLNKNPFEVYKEAVAEKLKQSANNYSYELSIVKHLLNTQKSERVLNILNTQINNERGS